MVRVNAIYLRSWLDALRPVRGKLTAPLAAIFRDKQHSDSQHTQATSILAHYAGDDPGRIADLLMDADPKAYAAFFTIAQGQEAATLPLFRAEIAKKSPFSHRPVISEQAKDQLAERQARAAVALVRMGRAEEVWPLLRHSPDPRLRSFIINWLNPLGADAGALATELARLESARSGAGASRPPRPAQRGEGGRRPGKGSATPGAAATEALGRNGNPSYRRGGRPGALASPGDLAPTAADSLPTPRSPLPPQKMDTILFHPETSIRRALILALGTYGPDALSPGAREPLTVNLLDLYNNDPDAGIHAAAEWALRQWNEQAKLKAAEVKLPSLNERGGRRWFVNSQGQTFALIEGPVEFTMGSPPTEPDRDSGEVAHHRLIPRRFAIATKEVSVRHYQEFVRQNPEFGLDRNYLDKYSPDPDGPMIGVSWFGAAAYCNWLSHKESLRECYEPNDQRQYAAGMRIRADAPHQTGYRLPTEAEWEYACRAGAVTSRHYGLSVNLLAKYARYAGNSAQHASPGGSLLPNDLGLFDMLGNAYEWCEDREYRYQAVEGSTNRGNTYISSSVDISISRLLRGGSFDVQPAIVRSAYRGRNAPSNRGTDLGFRPARTYD